MEAFEGKGLAPRVSSRESAETGVEVGWRRKK
jgi:hypothetical protein